jgi:hypothetical protein
MYFIDESRQRPVDVLVDRLEMCHSFAFGDRLTVRDITLPLAELLLSKLQIVRINRKDLLDMLALLSEYPLAESRESGDAISLRRIVDIVADDWGWWRTIDGNLNNLAAVAADMQPGELGLGRPPRYHVAEQISTLRETIYSAPKSLRWKLRARLGDRVTWYQEPEEVGHS